MAETSPHSLPPSSAPTTRMRFATCELDAATRELRRDGELVPIQPKAFDLLVYLASNPHRLVARAELFQAIWPDVVVSEETLSRMISRVRQALRDDGEEQRIIQTVRGHGFRFVAPLEAVDADRATYPTDSLPVDPFIGRESILEALCSGLQHTHTGAPSVYMVSGEAGVGKSRILREFKNRVRTQDDIQALTARCDEREGAPSYWMWQQILRQAAAVRAAAASESETDASSSLSPILSGLRNPPDNANGSESVAEPPEQARFQLFAAVSDFLHTLSQERPTILCFDDLQWADQSSLLLLEHVVQTLDDCPLMIVGTYRSEEVQEGHPLARTLTQLVRSPHFEDLTVRPLSGSAARELISLLSHETLSDALQNRLVETTDGNPFFLRESVRWLASHEANDLEEEGGESLPLPDSVRLVISRSVTRLSEECRELLRVGAVMGREFDLTIASRVLHLRREELTEASHEAISAGLLSNSSGIIDRLRFSHELKREAIYQTLKSTRRAELHEAVAREIEESAALHEHSDLERTAHHHFAAVRDGGGNVPLAFEHASRAAEQCLRDTAYDEAAKHYERGIMLLDLLPQSKPQDRSEQLLGLGEAQKWSGHVADSRETFQKAAAIARTLENPEPLARAALGVGLAFTPFVVGVVDNLQVQMLTEALGMLSEPQHPLRPTLLARLSLSLYWSGAVDRCRELGDAAVSAAREQEDRGVLAYALCAQYASRLRPTDCSDRLTIAEEMVWQSENASDYGLQLHARCWYIGELLIRGHRQEVDTQIAAVRRIADASPQAQLRCWCDVLLTTVYILQGDLERADEAAHRYVSFYEKLEDPALLQAFGGHMVTIRREQGRLEELVGSVELQANQYPDVALWKAVRAFIRAEIGQLAEARQDYEMLMSGDLTALSPDMTWPVMVMCLCELNGRFDDAEGAARLYELCTPHADENLAASFATYAGPFRRPLALLCRSMGRFDEAREHYLAGIESETRMGCPHWIERMREEMAALPSPEA